MFSYSEDDTYNNDSWKFGCVDIQKIIPFHEVTSVRRAKTAGIFPNAIEISAGGKKVVLDSAYHFLLFKFAVVISGYSYGLNFFVNSAFQYQLQYLTQFLI